MPGCFYTDTPDQRFYSLFYQTYYVRVAQIEPVEGAFSSLRVTWPVNTLAVSYNVYGSPSPFTKILLTPTPIVVTTFTYSIVPHVPEDLVWHFWVEWIDGLGGTHWVEDEPATIFTNTDKFSTNPQSTEYGKMTMPDHMMYFYKDEIRRRAKTVLENDGEDFEIYLVRFNGSPCPKTDARVGDSDPDYQSTHKCEICYGTGIIGGFWPKFTTKMRYGEMPPRIIKFEDRGIGFDENWNSWTLWLPKLHEHDIVVRKSTRQYLIVQKIRETALRGQPLRQEMQLVSLQPGDIRNLVTDAAILASLAHSGDSFAAPSLWG